MTRTVAGKRGDFEPRDPDDFSRTPGHEAADQAPNSPARRAYPVHGPWSQEDVVQWLMEHASYPRWQAVAATAIAIAMRSNSEPVPGGLVIIRVVPGGFELEDKSGRG